MNASEGKTRLQELLDSAPTHSCPLSDCGTMFVDDGIRLISIERECTRNCPVPVAMCDGDKINWALHKWQKEGKAVGGASLNETDPHMH